MAKARSLINKGRRFQVKIGKIFAEHFELEWDEDIRTAIGSETGCDVKLMSKKAKERVGLAIECKNVKSLNVWKSLEQASSNTPNGQTPALVFHRSKPGNKEVWIVVPLEHYLKLR